MGYSPWGCKKSDKTFQIKNYNNSLSLCTLYVLFTYKNVTLFYADFQVALVVKSPPANAGDVRCRFDPWVKKVPGIGKGYPLQYSRRRKKSITDTKPKSLETLARNCFVINKFVGLENR